MPFKFEIYYVEGDKEIEVSGSPVFDSEREAYNRAQAKAEEIAKLPDWTGFDIRYTVYEVGSRK